MEFLFDLQRISYGLESRLSAELSGKKANQLQMWLLLLIDGSQRKTMRGRKSLSANECAVELCIARTRVSNELSRLAKRKLITAIRLEKGADKRGRRFVLTGAGYELAQTLRLLLYSLEKNVLIHAGLRENDRIVEPQSVMMGLWLTGPENAKLPTLTRLLNMPDSVNAGDERGADPIRLKKVRVLKA